MDDKEALIPRADGQATNAEIKEFQTKVGTLVWLMVSDISCVITKL
jgi:hypothetical protein